MNETCYGKNGKIANKKRATFLVEFRQIQNAKNALDITFVSTILFHLLD